MVFVYLLRSISRPDKIYIGYTVNLEQRLEVHNRGDSLHTAKFMPWKIQAYFALETQEAAISFEKYLKSGSGRAFIAKHIVSK